MSITFVSEAHAFYTTPSQAKTITIPTTAVAGTFISLEYVGSQTQPDTTNPSGSGWTRSHQAQGGTCFATWWWKIATDSDAGSLVTVTAATNTKTALTMTVYAGVDNASPIAATAHSTETTSSLTHVDPVLSLAGGYTGVIIRSLALKDSSSAVSSTWTPAAGTVRSTGNTGGISAVVGLQSDSNSPYSSNGAWTVNAASQHAVTMATALTPAAVVPPAASGFRAAMTGGNDGETATTKTAVLTLPGTAAAGDTGIILASSNRSDVTVAPPTGWHQEATGLISTNNSSYVYSKKLVAADITAGSVTITWSALGRNIATGVVMYGMSATQPISRIASVSGTTASQAAPSVVTSEDNAQVLTLTSCRTASGAASVPTYPSGWTRRTNIATNFATAADMSCSIATLNTPGVTGTYGGETIAFSGPGTSSDSSEMIYTLACQTITPPSTRVLFQRAGASLHAVTLARREGASITLL